MKALIVGASGNIGSRLVPALRSRGHEVRAMVRPDSKRRPAADNVEIFSADVMKAAELKGAAGGVDVVYHLVGYLFAPRRSQVEPLNMAAARNVAEMAMAAGVNRLVFTSSVLVYGPNGRLPSAEDDPRRPDTAYSRAKAAVEDYLLSLAPHLQATIMRVGHVYGPNVSAIEEFKNLIERGFYRTAGPGEHLTPPINVDDLALALCLAGENPKAASRIYNVNDDEPLPLREFSDLLAERIGKGPVKRAPVWVFKSAAALLESLSKVTGRQPFFDLDTVTLMTEAHSGDNARLKRELGWSPKYKSFREGVATCFE